MTIEESKSTSAPYVSFRTFANVLDRLRDGGIPQHIDRHYWGEFMSGSGGQQLMAALRFLDLIDPVSNEPKSSLEHLVHDETRKETLERVIREAYKSIWNAGIDLERTTSGHLENTFKSVYGLEGETRRKAVTFFVHAAKLAEIPLSPQITSKTRQRRSTAVSGTKARPKARKSRIEGVPDQKHNVSHEEGAGMKPPGPAGQYAILHSLLEQLPDEGVWTSQRRDLWINALRANVDFLIAVEEDHSEDEGDYFNDAGS